MLHLKCQCIQFVSMHGCVCVCVQEFVQCYNVRRYCNFRLIIAIEHILLVIELIEFFCSYTFFFEEEEEENEITGKIASKQHWHEN